MHAFGAEQIKQAAYGGTQSGVGGHQPDASTLLRLAETSSREQGTQQASPDSELPALPGIGLLLWQRKINEAGT